MVVDDAFHKEWKTTLINECDTVPSPHALPQPFLALFLWVKRLLDILHKKKNDCLILT